ncbi:MAG: hypothetical protein WD359_08025 [Dehalococcoidia bacterium]
MRIVSEALLANGDWRPELFSEYAAERAERMRRLRISAALSSRILNEFGPEAEARRRRIGERMRADPTLQLTQLAAIIGPYAVPEFAFTDETIEKILA